MHVTTPSVDLTAATQAVTRVREAVPDRLLAKAEHSELGSQVRGLLQAVLGEEPDGSEASQLAHGVVPTVAAEPAATVAAVKEAAMSESRSGGRVLKVALGVLLIGAAAGGGYYVWSKRRAAAAEHLSGEGAWGTAPAVAEPFQAGMADLQSPDVIDEAFAAEVDAEAAEFAEDLADSIDLPEPQVPETAAEAAEVFEEGMAATQSPEAVDEQFAAEIDAAADVLSDSIVEGIDEPKS